jgi:serine/threonine protein kinase
MSAELVIAGKETLDRFPRAREFPLHFRKTYFPASFHGDPQVEFDKQTRAASLIACPEPIGWSPLSFRSCFLPGKPFSRISPFGLEPEENNIQVARELPLATAAGLWHLLEQAFQLLQKLHAGGFLHGDTELHNLIVCSSPLEVLLIDFENAKERESLTEPQWEKARAADLKMLLREAVFLQCALGPQTTEMAALAWESMECIVNSPNRFRREIKRQSEF